MPDFLAERGPELAALCGQHLRLVLWAGALAVGLGVPLGLALTRTPRLERAVLALAGATQTVPSLALFGLLIPLPYVGGVGARSALVALVLYALLPILRNTVVGVRQVDPAVREAADAMGLSGWQRLRLVELPLALPTILAGVRVAAVVSVGTATIAAAVGAGGLGTYIFRGLATLDTRLTLAGALPAAALALLTDACLARLERAQRPARAAGLLAAGALVVAALLSWPTAGPQRRALVVGSKNFTEQLLLGELLAGLLEARGFHVERRLNLGGTALCHEAVRSGSIDVYVEYTGTALTDVLHLPPGGEALAVREQVRAGYRRLGLEVLDPLGFDNSFALALRPEQARRRGLRRLSDLAAGARGLRLGLFGEFLEREDGLRGLQRAYGFDLDVAPREMDLGLLYPALQAGEVDVVVGSATDGLIGALGLVVLEDDRRYFPPYEAVPVVNAARLRAEPGLEAALRALGGRLDAAAMRLLNHAVDAGRRDPAAVAREFLISRGLARSHSPVTPPEPARNAGEKVAR